MSRFFSPKYQNLTPYVPGEQPQDAVYIKLNTNESPFPPSKKARASAAAAAEKLNLYSDPDSRELTVTMAAALGVKPENVMMTNGSDEALYFAFLAFCDKERPAAFPDVTYGFYRVFAALCGIPFCEIPLQEDFSIDPSRYLTDRYTLFIANPNAPTGLLLPLSDVEKIVAANPHRVVVVDEAYIDFGGQSAVPLVEKYDNLLVTGTFSKSRSMAGARLGFAVGQKDLIADLSTLRCSTNPYNVNRMTAAAGLGALSDEAYTRANCRTIIKNRSYAAAELKKLGFIMTDSAANFLFARHPAVDGEELYLKLKQKGILVRHFSGERIRQYNRITVGTKEQMTRLLTAIKEILGVQ